MPHSRHPSGQEEIRSGNRYRLMQPTGTLVSSEEVKEKPRYTPETCAHCEGEGCCYCDKTGKVLVAQPSRKCRHCDGDGCIYCGFTGWAGLFCSRSGSDGILPP